MSISGEACHELFVQLKNLIEIKKRYTNLDMAIHEICTKLAQSWLEARHPEIKSWYSNPRAEAGLDIFGPTPRELLVVAEVTAHEPILKTAAGKPRFGAQQKKRMRTIINKLLCESRAKKYLFVVTKDAKTATMDEFETHGIQLESLFDLFGTTKSSKM